MEDDGFDHLFLSIDATDRIEGAGASNINIPGASASSNILKQEVNEPLVDLSDDNTKRIPGPIGFLPKLTKSQVQRVFNTQEKPYTKIISVNAKIPEKSSDGKVNPMEMMKMKKLEMLFNGAPYLALMEHLSIDRNLLDATKIKWLRNKCRRFPPGSCIPFVCAVVEEDHKMDTHFRAHRQKAPCISIIDYTGATTTAVLTPRFQADFGHELKKGTALALRNVSFMYWKKHLVLRVSRNNIICMIFDGIPQGLVSGGDKGEDEKDDDEPSVTFVENENVHFSIPTVMEEFNRIRRNIEKKDMDQAENEPEAADDELISCKDFLTCDDVLFEDSFLSDNE